MFQLYKLVIRKIRDSLTTSVCKRLIHELVTSRLNYGNAMLFGITDRLLHRLEMVQRSAARIVMQIRQYAPRRCLRSAGGLLLDVPRVNLERFGRRAFACAGPTLWNKLPANIRGNGNHPQFKKLLKTFLFST